MERKVTWMVGSAIDESIKTPTSKTQENQIHNQVKKQQWSCHVPSHCLSHLFSLTTTKNTFKDEDG